MGAVVVHRKTQRRGKAISFTGRVKMDTVLVEWEDTGLRQWVSKKLLRRA